MTTELSFNCTSCGACNKVCSQIEPKSTLNDAVKEYLDSLKGLSAPDIAVRVYLDSLPADVKKIDVMQRDFTSLPSLERFTQLQELNCGYNEKLTALPALPNSLEELCCNYSKLKALPTLPPSLRELYCQFNELTALPKLPSGLQKLDCMYNKLTTLPDLPDSLELLFCAHNYLIELPNLPKSLKDLCYNDNKRVIKDPILSSEIQVSYF